MPVPPALVLLRPRGVKVPGKIGPYPTISNFLQVPGNQRVLLFGSDKYIKTSVSVQPRHGHAGDLPFRPLFRPACGRRYVDGRSHL